MICALYYTLCGEDLQVVQSFLLICEYVCLSGQVPGHATDYQRTQQKAAPDPN